ncbi:spermidine/putrescine ABC transporter permease/substrate-binding protein [Spiroplasma taiwanense]|uniref:Spermidine/putrescine ABC transporter permease n=1 Tax=Spiroplasma taiwanense CT-1 TaxID=1276220 RepID=S5MAR1_9MOLU|nr:spermidine/putrescine ABC transporter permease/substrate-binding protein [Spiroplasma taiwanense]AGR40848.1 spermidine/putrescine ABC transporter permease [Spiroplasma taiwanense CT-1]
MKKFIKSSYFLIMMLFIYVPIAVMIVFSFNNGNSLNNWEGFSFKWYEYLINYSPFIKSITVSLFVAMVSTIISLIIGIMAVVGLSKIKRKTADNWVRVANIPLVNADVITAVALMILFVLAGAKFGILTLIAAHVSFNVPYVIITVLPFMNRIDKNILEASKDLGGSSRQTFYKVIFPILMPCIITAAAICFAMSFDDFIISYFTGGDQTNVSTFIYTAKRMQPYINAFGTILVAVIIFVILVWNIIQISLQRRKDIKFQIKNGDYKLKRRSNLEKDIEYFQNCILNNSSIKLSKNPNNWIKYRFLQIQLKFLNSKNHDKKISKLEWKKELLSKEIKSEKRIFLISEKLKIKKSQIENKIKTIKNEKKLIKFEQIINKLDKKINNYEKEIQWINERNELDKEKARQIENQILDLNQELANLINPTQKELSWYKKKINSLTIKMNYLLEGRNNWKLRTTIEKLAIMRQKNEEQAREKYLLFKEAEKKVYINTSLVKKLNNKIKKMQELNEISELEKSNLVKFEKRRKEKIDWFKEFYQNKIFLKKNKLDKIYQEIKSKKDKFFPNVLEEDYIPRKNNWIKRNWKQMIMGSSLLISFSLLTTAYALNNVYDLVIGNWGSYIDPTLLTQFENENGVKINYQQYDSNESLYNKTYTFNYDMMVPSDYMVQKMAGEGMLQEIDWSKVENINSPLDSNSGGKDLTYNEGLNNVQKESVIIDSENGEQKDIRNYSIPWFWGDVRIVFNLGYLNSNGEFVRNQKLVDFLEESNVLKEDFNPTENEWYQIDPDKLSWNILWEAANKGLNLALNEDPKNVFMYGFEKLYGNVGTKNDLTVNDVKLTKKEQIDNVAEEINKLISKNNVGLYGDQLLDKVHNKEFDIAVMYNGDLLWATDDEYSSEDEEEISNEITDLDDENSSKEESDFKFTIISEIPNKSIQNVKVNDVEVKNESTNLWSDNLVINKANRNIDLTYKFINFIFSYDSQIAQVEETRTTSGFEEIIQEIKNNSGVQWEKWYLPHQEGQAFGFDEKFDNYLVDKFNEIISTKH